MNENVKIYICTHTDFECPVHNPVYEVIDARDINGDQAENGLHGAFYSELLIYKYLADHWETLPRYIGFCHYRKYFGFMDDVPDLESILSKGGFIATERQRFDVTVYEQYCRFHARQDIDLLRREVERYHKWNLSALDKMLLGYEMHTCNMFIMPTDIFRLLMRDVWGMLDSYLSEAGDIEARIKKHPEWYHLQAGDEKGFAHQYRIGGYLGERLIGAFLMSNSVVTYPMITTGKRKRHNL